MKFRKVRLDDAYLDGKMGFNEYLCNAEDHSNSDDFYKSILSDYDNITYGGVAIDEIMFYVLGFFDDYNKEKEKRDFAGDKKIELEKEDWIQKLMEKTGVTDIDDLGAAMVSNLMIELDYIYKDSREVKRFLEERIDKKSTYIKEKLADTSYSDWVKIRAKERRFRR